ncbi:UDP-N-acetylmuramate dehydrogenase [Brucepastera parasyntrophica]|uniref:UDP-N-acetylmuramate dehydrogenase n=1 Tax=Brucepastera parasyntrophica TaxID=2880008 RepID=UPI00210C0A9A|nr:UDP-N-acetylmuramate dehydrogenase [Brucepastera parasyntrophica]ULQ60650.1 UDP-N-acetylmuramate dehydrogenase [Brucepastera parasyntrophica]
MNNVRKLLENSNITKDHPLIRGLLGQRKLLFDEPMSAHTSFRTGGPADVYIEPENREILIELITFFMQNGIPVSIVGGGSNLLVSDTGIRGAVLSPVKLDRITFSDTGDPDKPVLVTAEAGCEMNTLTQWCAEHGLSGLESFAGLPGTVGGAAYMNARCYACSISDVFFEAEIVGFREERCIIEKRQYIPSEWEYKRSPFQKEYGEKPLLLYGGTPVILSVTFRLFPGLPEHITQEMNEHIRDREEKGHFRYPSAGSAFKNNREYGKPSGKIIDETGLCGLRIGDAQVSPWHGNFIINTGNARASEVYALIKKIKEQVYDRTGFVLEPEIIIAGEWENIEEE